MLRRRALLSIPILTVVVFLASSFIVYQITGHLFHPSMDEGIYLEGGARVLAGQAPYRDFFAFTGPMTYWVVAALEGIFGPNLPMLRWQVAASFGMTAAGLFWMAAPLAGRAAGLWAVALYHGMTLPSVYRLTIGHRWMSAGLMSLAAAAALQAARASRPRAWWAAAGAISALACWTTPTFAVPLLAMALWLLGARARRAYFLWLGLGAAAASAPAVLWLAGRGALGPMLHSLLWASSRYAQANSVPYGYFPGGFAGWVTPVRLLAPVWAMPAMLIAAAVLIRMRRLSGGAALLALLAGGFLATAYPRWDVNQLQFVTPPFYALLAVWASRLPRPAWNMIHASGYMASLFLAALVVPMLGSLYTIPTRVGDLRGTEADAVAMDALERRVPPGSSALVFPYFPVLGYILRTKNPIAYTYLQPGMMSSADEATALRGLVAHPPRFILEQYLPDDQVLTVWPRSDRSQLAFQSIRDFIARQYRQVEVIGSDQFRITVHEIRP